MGSRSKQRTEQHIIDSDAQILLRSTLPKHWILREYRPDYGLDFSLEIFTGVTDEAEKKPRFETLGEHIFVQLKGCKRAKRMPLKVYGRYNVEKSELNEDRSDLVGEMEVIPFSIEVSELLTVQRMGAGLPVLLIQAELDSGNCYFVCLNDYIDKVLVPRHGDYTSKETRTIHIPTKNVMSDPVLGTIALRWYAKRSKMFAAFQKFIYQQVELDYASNSTELSPMLRKSAFERNEIIT